MALKKQFMDRDGNVGEYINLDISLANKTSVTLMLNFWKDKATRDTATAIPYNDQLTGSRKDRIVGFDTVYDCIYDLNSSDNIFVQGYNYLKTLPEFNGAEDC